jgi:hypothetical protein
MLTYGSKFLIVPALVVVGLLGLFAFLLCRALIGACVRRTAEDDAAA